MVNEFGSVDIFCEFLEAAIHQILHARDVYPQELFQRGKLYNVPVQKSRHPDLNDYVSHLVRSIHGWMSKGGVESVILLIVDSRQQPLERFVFEFRRASSEEEAAGLPLPALERMLSAFMTKISLSHAVLRPLPQDCHFQVLVCSPEEGPEPVPEVPGEPLWLEECPAEGGFGVHTSESPALSITAPAIVPMKTLRCGSMRIQLHVEVQPEEAM
ncbi:hypothetical protein CYMTET_45619 [Cymbomonas tetramitiformis]|uniref:HORMA domain-containing protein n=1 Tax=Cymbomonas tetramitiformis TaxID=36881 RepID=A0AAE0BZ54_9CHLO|nr:hypothetical protein CYMTET_45619 [Cymbomonas tetramitiformis]